MLKPPSSDPPGFSAVSPKRRPKKPGAKKGHQPHLRQLFPPEKVTHRIELKPEVCFCGGTHFEECDEEPLRHQIVDIPPIVPEVTEYIQHVCRCKDCGELVYAPLPHEVRRRHFGPGVLALVAVLTGVLNTSKRKALAMMNEVFSVPMSLGGLSNCEAQGALGKTGQELYGLAKKILKMRQRVRDGTLQWRTFQNRMAPLMLSVEKLLPHQSTSHYVLRNVDGKWVTRSIVVTKYLRDPVTIILWLIKTNLSTKKFLRLF